MKGILLSAAVMLALASPVVVAQDATGGGGRDTARTIIDRRGYIFVQRGCQDCHGIRSLGVAARHAVGPDLSMAYGDVVSRYGVSLRSFLEAPRGIMRSVLATRARLSRLDQDSIADVLESLYEKTLARTAPDARQRRLTDTLDPPLGRRGSSDPRD